MCKSALQEALKHLNGDNTRQSVDVTREIVERAVAEIDRQDAKYEALQTIGKATYESIVDMVAALECDYDRLEELRDTLKQADDDLADGCCEYQTAELDEMRQERGELEAAAGECKDREEAERRIHEDPLSLTFRGDWYTADAGPADAAKPVEFEILLGTGGPATRIIGDLSDYEPTSPRLQVQDWGTAWTDYRGGDSETLLAYCRCFYFGEG